MASSSSSVRLVLLLLISLLVATTTTAFGSTTTPTETTPTETSDTKEIELELAEPSPFPTDITPSPAGQLWGALLTFKDTCILNKNPAVKDFIEQRASTYPQLRIHFVSVEGKKPRFQLFSSKSQRDTSLIVGGNVSEDDLLAMLRAGPNEDLKPVESVTVDGWTMSQLEEYLEIKGFQKTDASATSAGAAAAATVDKEPPKQKIFDEL